MTNKKYFFSGYDSNIILVDAFYKNVWLTTNNEKIAHQIRKTFYSKVNLVVYNLHSFKNYKPNLIDNEVCLDWQITPATHVNLVQQSLHFSSPSQTQHAESHQMLINTKIVSLLSNEKIINLQQQMMLYHTLLSEPVDTKLELYINDIFSHNLDLKTVECALSQLPINVLYQSVLGRKLLTMTNRLYA